MYIEHGELWIRKAESSDARMLAQWWNDGKIMAHAGFPHGLGTTEDKVREQLNSSGPSQRLIIGVKDVAIGEMSYRDVGEKTAEIGIKICLFEYQNQGLGTIYLQMLLDYLKSIGFTKVILDTNLNNLRAQHVYEKIGFKKVGIRYHAFKDQDGFDQSSVDYVYDFLV